MKMHCLEIQKEYSVPAQVVFDAWLNPDLIRLFMCPADGVTVPSPAVDAKVGGKFLFDMKIGPDKSLPHKGEYRIINRPKQLQFTWSSINTNNEDSLVTIDIEDTGSNSCLLKLKHELLPTENSRKDHNGGWNNILKTLNEKLSL